jgi:hypothetical protein
LPLPDGIDASAVTALWPVNLKGWRASHKAACAR